MPETGASGTPQPAWTPPPPPSATLAPPAARRGPSLAVRAGADRRVMAGALAGGAAFDVAARSGVATLGGTIFVIVAAAVIVASGRIRGHASRVVLGSAVVLGLTLTFRSSPWVIAPAVTAVAGLLVLGVSLGADGSGLGATFPALGGRIVRAVGHLVLAPGMFRSREEPGADGTAPKRATAVARGALLSVPILLVVGLLLALADPIFRSWLDTTALLKHVLLVLVGAWAVLGLSRVASAERPAPVLPNPPALGTVEATIVLGGLSALYTAFVIAQFVALSGAGRRILVTHGLTYAQYARSGFFQLLACAAITLLVLLGVRACADPDHPVLLGLAGLTTVLTVGVVVVAIRRLELYEAAYGLTMLRLACLVAAVWIGIVFLLLGSTLPRRGLPRRQFPVAVIVSAFLFTAAWSAANPASIVALTNLRRAEHGRSLDVSQAAGLGPDAVPALAARLEYLSPSQGAELRRAICGRPGGRDAGAALNLSRAGASETLARLCRSPAGQVAAGARLRRMRAGAVAGCGQAGAGTPCPSAPGAVRPGRCPDGPPDRGCGRISVGEIT